MPGPRRWSDATWLCLVTLAVRLPVICLHNFSSDEAFAFYLSRLPLQDLMVGLQSSDRSPPLHYILLHGLILLGTSEAWLRLPSVLFDLASVLAIQRLTLKLGGGRWAAVVAAGLHALFYSAWNLDTQARMSAMAQCGALLATEALFDMAILHREGWRVWLRYALSAALATWSIYLSFVVLGTHVIIALAVRRRTAMGAVGLGILLSAPLLGLMAAQGGGHPEAFLPLAFGAHVANLYPLLFGLPAAVQAATHADVGVLLMTPVALGVCGLVTLVLGGWQAQVVYRMPRPAGLFCGLLAGAGLALLLAMVLTLHLNLRD